jgi:hypothetical protein
VTEEGHTEQTEASVAAGSLVPVPTATRLNLVVQPRMS